MNPHTVQISEKLARRLVRHQAHIPCSDKHLPDSILRAREARLALADGPAENLPRQLYAWRGGRAAATMIPENMRENFAASESAAWDHSELAGILWELGIRSATARKWAEEEKLGDGIPNPG